VNDFAASCPLRLRSLSPAATGGEWGSPPETRAKERGRELRGPRAISLFGPSGQGGGRDHRRPRKNPRSGNRVADGLNKKRFGKRTILRDAQPGGDGKSPES